MFPNSRSPDVLELEEIAWCSRTRDRLMFPNSRSPDILELEIAWCSRTRGDRLIFSNSRRSPDVLELEEIALSSRTRGDRLIFSNSRRLPDVLELEEIAWCARKLWILWCYEIAISNRLLNQQCEAKMQGLFNCKILL